MFIDLTSFVFIFSFNNKCVVFQKKNVFDYIFFVGYIYLFHDTLLFIN